MSKNFQFTLMAKRIVIGAAVTASVLAFALTSEAATKGDRILLEEARISAQAEMQTLSLEFQKSARERLVRDYDEMVVTKASEAPQSVEMAAFAER